MSRIDKFKKEAKVILWLTGAVIAGPVFLVGLYCSLRKQEKWFDKILSNNHKRKG